jgi:hypothetical protein
MIKTIKRLWRQLRSDGHEELRTPKHEDAVFVLRYKDLDIGTLRLHEGIWSFEYSDEFRMQSEVKPLVAFEDVDRKYEADSLWPFFIARIPSIAQPDVLETIQREGLDEHSDVQLLRRFGKRTIANPFVLQESH